MKVTTLKECERKTKMKKLKCYLSILLVLSMMLCSASVFTINAVPVAEDNEIVIEVVEDLGGEDELQPTMAPRCTTPIYYRYWGLYTPREIDMKIENGYLTTTCGISVNTNPGIQSLIDKYGPAQIVSYIPSGLRYYHTGGTHYVIAPEYQMTREEYISLCAQIR